MKVAAAAEVLACKDYFSCQTYLDLLQLRSAQAVQQLHLALMQVAMSAAPAVSAVWWAPTAAQAGASVQATAAVAVAVLALARAHQADLATALYCQVPHIILLADQAKVITAAQPAVLLPVPLLFGAVAVAVAPTMQLNALAAIASTVVMAVHLTPAPLHPYRVVAVADREQQQLLAVLAVLAFASFTSGDSYGLRNR
jgi:hypothetical protein